MDFGKGISSAKHALDYSALKNNTISNNLANINNPEYKRKHLNDISFEDVIKQEELKVNNERHINISSVAENNDTFIHSENSQGRNDGNNVSLDKEVIEQTKNRLFFKTYTEVLSSQYKSLTDVIV